MWENGIIFSVVIVNMNVNTEIVEGSDDEAVEGEPIEAKSSKKEKKRQEREDKRQVLCASSFCYCFLKPFIFSTVIE